MQVMISIQTNKTYSELEIIFNTNGLNIKNIHLLLRNFTDLTNVKLNICQAYLKNLKDLFNKYLFDEISFYKIV